MNVQVAIPWIESDCEWRTKAKVWTAAHWAGIGAEVIYGYSHTKPANRSAARNDAWRKTSSGVVFFADADTFVCEDQFSAAVGLARDTGRLVQAYERLVRLHRSHTLATYGGRLNPVGQMTYRQPLGCVAVSRALLDEVGGFDERFSGWGGEDRAFQLACDTLAGKGSRVPADAYHLWHPRSPEQGRKTAVGTKNISLALRYKDAAGHAARAGILRRTPSERSNPQAMRAILAEPGGPLSETLADSGLSC